MTSLADSCPDCWQDITVDPSRCTHGYADTYCELCVLAHCDECAADIAADHAEQQTLDYTLEDMRDNR